MPGVRVAGDANASDRLELWPVFDHHHERRRLARVDTIVNIAVEALTLSRDTRTATLTRGGHCLFCGFCLAPWAGCEVGENQRAHIECMQHHGYVPRSIRAHYATLPPRHYSKPCAVRMAGDVMTIEIKPCPFCGKAVSLEFEPGNDVRIAIVSIQCDSCKTVRFTEEADDWKPGRGTFSIRDKAEPKLIARWNERSKS